jgi:hypothetical protein
MNDAKNDSLITFEKLRLEIRVKAKMGVDFVLAAGIVWFGIFLIWRFTENTSYNKSIFTFISGALLMPIAFGFSKILKTTWKIKNNPLEPLGLWLNFAQLIYFPFLVFVLIKYPDYFIMAYAIITGAHLFPYAWFYEETGYAVAAVIVSVVSMLLALILGPELNFYIPIFTSVALLILGVWILIRFQSIKAS